MTLAKYTSWTLLLVVGFSLISGFSAAQDPTKVPQRGSSTDIEERRDAGTIDKKDKVAVEAAKKTFASFAKYYAEIIAHPLVYKAAQQDGSLKILDGKPVDAASKPIPTIEEKIKELEKFILEPNPAITVFRDDATELKVSKKHADYIREFGAALDDALKPVIESSTERVIRVNAMRMYAAACKSGAPAHWPTVIELLKNANTKTEVKYYALQAAANLLSASDVFDYKSRRHAFTVSDKRSENDKQIGELIAAVEACILDPNTVIEGIPEGKIENASADQLDVVRFVRRQAIKTLAQVRSVTLPGPDGKPLFPALTLARVCMSDPALVPAPSPAECAEAVIGLCNMAPVVGGAPVKGFNTDSLAEAVTTGLITFAKPRAEKPLDRTLAWRNYSYRLGEAFKNWRPIFDTGFDPTKPTDFNPAPGEKAVGAVIALAQDTILAPIGKIDDNGKLVDGLAVDLTKLRTLLKQLQAKEGRTGLLINGVPETAMPVAAAK